MVYWYMYEIFLCFRFMLDELVQKGFFNVINNGFLGNLMLNSNYGFNVGIFKNKKDL